MGVSILTGAELADLPANAIDLTPFLNIIMLAVDILEWTGVIPDPIALLLSLFSGRPREEATAQVIQWLHNQRNPAARLWGVTLSRLLTDDDIVISDSSAAGQKLLGQARGNFVDSLVAQGATPQNAQTIAQIAMSVEAQNGTAVSDFLKQPAPQGFGINGPSSMASLYSKALQLGQAAGKTGTALSTYATKYTFKHANLDDLLHSSILPALPQSYTPTAAAINSGQPCAKDYTFDSTTGTCNINSILPITGQTCPPGYTYDATSYLCVWTPPPGTPAGPGTPPGSPGTPGSPGSPPGPGQPGIIPPPPTPGPGGDELTDCCNLTASYLYYIATGLQALANSGAAPGAPSSGTSDACCNSVVNVLTQIAVLIQNLPAAWASANPVSGAPAVDLTGVLTVLGDIQAAISQLDTDANNNAVAATNALTNIANAIAANPPTDLTGIVKELAALVVEGDVPQAILDYLGSQGYLSSSDLQVLSGAPWASTFVMVFRTWAWNALLWIASWVGISWNGKSWSMAPISSTIANDISSIVSSALSTGAAPLLPEIKGLVDGVVAQLKPATTPVIGNIGVDPELLLAKTLAPALIMNAVAMVAGYFGWELSEALEKWVDWAAEFAGLAEVAEVLVGQLMRYGPVRVAEMTAKAQYRQELPGLPALQRLAAAGWMTIDRVNAIAPYTGTPAELVAPMMQAAYTSMPERMLLQLLESPLFAPADFKRVLTEHGMRPVDQALLMAVAPYIATKSQRSQLISTYEKLYTEGLSSDAELTADLASAENNTDLDSLVMTRVRIEKLITETVALEKTYTTMAIQGLMDAASYEANLTGLGYQPDFVNNLLAVGANKIAIANYRRLEAEERALVRATAAVERKAALQNFNSGTLDTAGYATALVATGLTATQAAAWADLAALRKDGSQKWIYGLRLTQEPANLLRARVTALADQRKHGLISDGILISQLQALGIPQVYINAIRAAADATPATGTVAEFVPVSTG